MDEDWTSRAFCRGMPSSFFYPDNKNEEEAAREVCCDCRVRIECLNWAVSTNETEGVWGGTTEKVRRRLRQIWLTGETLNYQRAVAAETDRIGKEIAGYDIPKAVPDKIWTDEHDCRRCGGFVAAGFHAADRNTEHATCGIPATYNKGCRCEPCRQAKARLVLDEKQKRARHSPRGEQMCLGFD